MLNPACPHPYNSHQLGNYFGISLPQLSSPLTLDPVIDQQQSILEDWSNTFKLPKKKTWFLSWVVYLRQTISITYEGEKKKSAKIKKFHVPQSCSKEMTGGWKPRMEPAWYMRNYVAHPSVQWKKWRKSASLKGNQAKIRAKFMSKVMFILEIRMNSKSQMKFCIWKGKIFSKF